MPPSVSEGKDKPTTMQRGGSPKLLMVHFHQLGVNSHVAQCRDLSLTHKVGRSARSTTSCWRGSGFLRRNNGDLCA